MFPAEKPQLPGLRGDSTSLTENAAYVHWKGTDRRLDCWLKWNYLRKIDENLGDNAVDESEESDDGHAGMDADYLKEHVENTKFKTINRIQMGPYLVDCWYFSPYPLEVQDTNLLYICNFCLGFYKFESEASRHHKRCTSRHPPGNEIYR